MKILITDAAAFQDFYLFHQDIELPLKLSFKLAKLYRQIVDEMSFYNDTLNKYIKKYAEHDEEGKPIINETGIRLKKETSQIAQEKFAELNSLTFDCDVSFTLEEFEDIKLTPREIMALMPFITE